MKRFLVLFLLLFSVTVAQEIYQSNNSTINSESPNQIAEEDLVIKESWINSFFLTKRIFLYPVLKAHIEDIDITQEQLSIIQDFYKKNLPVMVEKAEQIKNYEDELHDLVLHNG
ncbi:MAG: hypothetical protein D6831_03865, partial [Aquificota bacterium]